MTESNIQRRRPRQGTVIRQEPLRLFNMKMISLVVLLAGLPSFGVSFSMVSPPITTVARPPPPVLTETALYHPPEQPQQITGGWKTRMMNEEDERRVRRNSKIKRDTGKHATTTRSGVRPVQAHESRLFLADPSRASSVWQEVMNEQQQLQQQKLAAVPASAKPIVNKVRNLADFVVHEFDNQQLSKGRALLVSPQPSEPNTRTIGDVLFAQESLRNLWKMAGEAVVDYGLVSDNVFHFLDLGKDGAFQVE